MKLVTLLLSLTLLLLPYTTSAMPNGLGNERSKPAKPPKVSSPQKAAKVAQGRVGGKVLKVQSTRANGQQAYRVKVLKNDGHIVSLLIDAQTGRIIGN